MRRASPPGRRFLTDRRGVSAVEFSVILPFVLLLIAGGMQLILYLSAIRNVDRIANSISEILSQTTPPPGSDIATVNSLDLHFAFDSAMVLFPYLLGDSSRRGEVWSQNISLDFASIRFTPKNATCAASGDPTSCYAANVVWTSLGTSGSNKRRCAAQQTPAADTAPPTPLTLPNSVFGPGSLIAVDVVYLFRPTFGSGVLEPLRIARSVFRQPRYATLITYDTTNDDGIAVKCPGY